MLISLDTIDAELCVWGNMCHQKAPLPGLHLDHGLLYVACGSHTGVYILFEMSHLITGVCSLLYMLLNEQEQFEPGAPC